MDKDLLQKEVQELSAKKAALIKDVEDIRKQFDTLIEGKPTIGEHLTTRIASVQATLNQMAENIDKVQTYHNELLLPKEGHPKSLFETVKDTAAQITADQLKAAVEGKVISEYRIELLGDEENKIDGLKQRLTKVESDILEKKRAWEESAATLLVKIEALIPGATSAGLASAYKDQRGSYKTPYWIWASVFVFTLVGTICFSIHHINKILESGRDLTFETAIMSVIAKLPFFVPAFWLAIFASKQQSQNKRLQQEYAYKEAVTKSYEADKREIEKLPESEEKQKLSAKLLEIMIDMTKFNPSETLSSKAHNDGPPSVFELFKIKMMAKTTGIIKKLLQE